MWSNPDIHEGNIIPQDWYPAFAPLPAPFAQHLVTQEYRRRRRAATRKRPIPLEPPPHVIWQAVLSRVERARAVVFEVMHPEVVKDLRVIAEEGERASFPDSQWLLSMLTQYTPTEEGPKEWTLRAIGNWVERGLLTRAERGTLDKTSVASLLTARIAEEIDEIKWLPTEMSADEPRWWCYGRKDSRSPVLAIPVPLPEHLPRLLLWTPWINAAWDGEWTVIGSIAARWSPAFPTQSDLTAYGVTTGTTGTIPPFQQGSSL